MLGERRPGLLTGDHPLVAVAHGARLNIGEIAPRVRLGVPLAPELFAADDAGEEALLLLLRAQERDRRADELLSEVADTAGGADARVLFDEDDLLVERGAAAAVLLRPREARPPFAPHLLLPGDAELEQLVLVARAAASDELREFARERSLEPAAGLDAERLFGR